VPSLQERTANLSNCLSRLFVSVEKQRSSIETEKRSAKIFLRLSETRAIYVELMVRVSVVLDTGSSFSHETPNDSTIEALKISLVAITRCSPECMILTYRGKSLKDTDNIRALRIHEGDSIQFFMRSPNEFEVFVLPLTGEILRFTLSPKDTVVNLLAKVKAERRVRTSMQLLHKSRPLPTDVSIASLKLGPAPQFQLCPKPLI